MTSAGLTRRLDDPNGPVLNTFTVSAIVPGAHHDLSCRRESPPPNIDGQRTVWTVVDECGKVDEFNEANNTRLALVSLGNRPGDLDGDDDVDLSDLAALPANYGTTSVATYGVADIYGDGDVDLSDPAALSAVYGTVCE